jgi:hypothetical protein
VHCDGFIFGLAVLALATVTRKKPGLAPKRLVGKPFVAKVAKTFDEPTKTETLGEFRYPKTNMSQSTR